MRSLTGTIVPRDVGDASVRAALRSEYAYAERLRTAILGWLVAGMVGLFMALDMATVLGAAVPAKPPYVAQIIAVTTAFLLAALQFAVGRRAATRPDDRARSTLWYAAALVEVTLILGAWSLVGTLVTSVRTVVPGLIVFSSLVILSALRLDWRLTGFTSVLTAVGYAYLHVRVADLSPYTSPRPRVVDGIVSLLVVGALTALVAEQARRRTIHALRAILQTQALQRDILHAEDSARARIGRDLHDGLGGRLSGIAMMAQGLARRAESGAAASAASLRELADLSLEGVDEVRRLARGLDPAPVEFGLVESLRRLADRVTSAGTTCTFAVDGDTDALDASITLQLYHIAHEATTNAVKHGAPSRVDVTLTARTGTITLDVRDNGEGIAEAPEPGLGLRTMARRAELLDGVLRVRRGPLGGTIVSCIAPR
jgi:signal transduction histidine kinase